MANVPIIVSKRLITAVPKFKKILAKAKERDVNESDTVTIVTDMLEEVFGFDKYSEITREFAIQGTYCDLAIKSGKQVDYLIEVKAIGLELKENHIKQAVNYASREGINWVVLTNGNIWHLYRVTLENKVESELLFKLDFNEINIRKTDQQELLFLLCKRGVQKDLINDFYQYRQSVNRYTIGAILLTEPVITAVRKELKRLKPGLKVDVPEITSVVEHEVIKREILDSDTGKDTHKQITKLIKQEQKAKARKKAQTANKTIVAAEA